MNVGTIISNSKNKNLSIDNEISSMKSRQSLYSFQSPISTQVSFVVSTVKGTHFGKQSLIVSVNGHLFILNPRTVQKRFRYYDSGYTLFIEPNTAIKISIGIFTPSSNKGYLHSFIMYKMRKPKQARCQNLELFSYGNTYQVTFSLYVSPCYIYNPAAINKPDKRVNKEIERDRNQKNRDARRIRNVDSEYQEYNYKFAPNQNQRFGNQKYNDNLDSFSDRYSLSYTTSSSPISSDDEVPNSRYPHKMLSSLSETDETSTLVFTSSD